MSFGNKGALLFSVLNIVQLIGWTAIMIYDGALAANGIVNVGNWIWYTLPDMIITIMICVAGNKVVRCIRKRGHA